MTKESFEKLCEDNDITWNDKIIITIYNPFKRWYKFGEPKHLVFKGYLLYHEGDEVVHVSVIDEDEKLIPLFIDFDNILNIEKYENL
jgi:hypothetical protein